MCDRGAASVAPGEEMSAGRLFGPSFCFWSISRFIYKSWLHDKIQRWSPFCAIHLFMLSIIKRFFFLVEHSLRKEGSLLSGVTAADTSVSLGRWQQDEARKSVLTSPISLMLGKWYQWCSNLPLQSLPVLHKPCKIQYIEGIAIFYQRQQ